MTTLAEIRKELQRSYQNISVADRYDDQDPINANVNLAQADGPFIYYWLICKTTEARENFEVVNWKVIEKESRTQEAQGDTPDALIHNIIDHFSFHFKITEDEIKALRANLHDTYDNQEYMIGPKQTQQTGLKNASWECKKCTYKNTDDEIACTICSTKKPEKKSQRNRNKSSNNMNHNDELVYGDESHEQQGQIQTDQNNYTHIITKDDYDYDKSEFLGFPHKIDYSIKANGNNKQKLLNLKHTTNSSDEEELSPNQNLIRTTMNEWENRALRNNIKEDAIKKAITLLFNTPNNKNIKALRNISNQAYFHYRRPRITTMIFSSVLILASVASILALCSVFPASLIAITSISIMTKEILIAVSALTIVIGCLLLAAASPIKSLTPNFWKTSGETKKFIAECKKSLNFNQNNNVTDQTT